MTHIKKINEFINSVNETSWVGKEQYQEQIFSGKLVEICNNILKYKDDLLNIWDAALNTRNTMLQFDNMSMDARSNVIYFDYHFYDDKHVVMSIQKKNRHNYLYLTGEFNRNNIHSSAAVMPVCDLSKTEIVHRVNNLLDFHYRTVDGSEGIWVDLYDEDGIKKVDVVGGDEFLGLFEEFDEEFPSFVENLKVELNTL